MRKSNAALLMLPLLVAACSDTAADSGWDTAMSTLPNGASHVVHTPPSDAAPTWQIEEELRIGTVDGGGPESFAQLKGLAALPDGGVAVLDAQAQEIRIFDAAGAHRATFGGRGGGPGEFQGAFGLMLDSDGMLWVPDHSLNRVSVVDPGTGFVTSYPFNFFSYGFVWDGVLTVDGRIALRSITLSTPRRNVVRVYGEPAGTGDTGSVQNAAAAAGVPSELVQLDSLPLPDPQEPTDPKNPPGAFYWEAPDGRSMGYMSVPHYPSGRLVLDPRLAFWSTQGGDPSYRIIRWTPGGDTTLVIETTRPPVPVTQAERDSIIDRLTESLRERGAAGQDWSKIPQTKPAVTYMFLAENGDLWVQAATADTLRTYDVYAQNGSYTGTAVTTLKIYQFVSPVVRDGVMWAIVTDDFEVQHVVRARVVPVSPGREQ